MKIIFVLFSALAAVLGAIINADEDCHADNCLRAVAGSDPRYDISSRRELCSSWMSATGASGPSASSSAPAKRAVGTANETATSAALPRHATVCGGVAAYSSACSCWGITAVDDAGPTMTGLSSATNLDGHPTAEPTLSSTSNTNSSRISTGSIPTPSGEITSGISSGFPTSDAALSSGIFLNVSVSIGSTTTTFPSLVPDPTLSGTLTTTGSISDGPPSIGLTLSSVLPLNSTSGISSIQASSSPPFSNSSRSLVLPTNSGSGGLSSSASTRPITSPSTLSTEPASLSSSRIPFTNTTSPPTSGSFSSFATAPSSFPNSTLASSSPTATACAGGTCDTYRAWPCSGPLGDCLCGLDPTGASFCFEDNECALEADCASNLDCLSGQRCVVRSCCLASKCVIERKAGTCGNANGARMTFGLNIRGEPGETKQCGNGRNGGGC